MAAPAAPLTDRDRRAVMLAAYLAITAGSFAAGELVYLAVRWALHHLDG